MKLKTLFVLLLCVFLTGCMKTYQLKERAIVQALGIDYKDNEYEVSIQIFNPSEKGELANSFDKKSMVLSAKGKTITKACETLSNEFEKQIFLGSNKIIIIGKEVALYGLQPLSELLSSHSEYRPNTAVFIAQNTAKEIVEGSEDTYVSGLSMQRLSKRQNDTGTTPSCNIMDLVSAFYDDGIDPMISVVELNTNGKMVDAAISQSVVFVNDKLAGQLNSDQTMGVQLLKGDIKEGLISVKDSELGEISLTVKNPSSKISCKIYDNKPTFFCKVKINLTVNEIVNNQGKSITPEQIPSIERTVEEQVIKLMDDAVNEAVGNNKSDVIGFGQVLRKYEPQYWQQHKSRWINEKINIAYDVRCSIKRIGQ